MNIQNATQLTYLSIGSNIESRINYINDSLLALQKIGSVTAFSSVYETQSWGFSSNNFLNIVIEFETTLQPLELLTALKGIERDFGRVTTRFYSNRPIDIDILFYADTIIVSPELTLPHSLLHERNFVLIPMREINPYFIHPQLNTTIIDLCKQCHDSNHIQIVTEKLVVVNKK
jgi:2-amino-4-hydroxy-6-hydroxymethyldihydropteridine diphosphokinase